MTVSVPSLQIRARSGFDLGHALDEVLEGYLNDACEPASIAAEQGASHIFGLGDTPTTEIIIEFPTDADERDIRLAHEQVLKLVQGIADVTLVLR